MMSNDKKLAHMSYGLILASLMYFFLIPYIIRLLKYKNLFEYYFIYNLIYAVLGVFGLVLYVLNKKKFRKGKIGISALLGVFYVSVIFVFSIIFRNYGMNVGFGENYLTYILIMLPQALFFIFWDEISFRGVMMEALSKKSKEMAMAFSTISFVIINAYFIIRTFPNMPLQEIIGNTLSRIIPMFFLGIIVGYVSLSNNISPTSSLAFRVPHQIFIVASPIIVAYHFMSTAFIYFLATAFTMGIALYVFEKETYKKSLKELNTWIKGHKKTIFVLLLILVGITGFLGNLVAKGYMLTPQVVLTGSMEPTLSKGDMLFIKRVSPDELNIGEIVAYKRGGVIVVHRVINITSEGFKTKGDANDAEDCSTRGHNWHSWNYNPIHRLVFHWYDV